MSSNHAHQNGHTHLVINRVYSAPRALVWQAWTEPEQLARWWSPDGFTVPTCELDVRPGGSIHIDMQGPDGALYPSAGEYREVLSPSKLVFTMSPQDKDGRPLFTVLQTVTFSEQAETDSTALTVSAEVLSATAAAKPYLDGMETGLNQALDKLPVSLH